MRVLLLTLPILVATMIAAMPKPAMADMLTCPIHVDNLTESMVIDTDAETATVTSKFVPENHYVFAKNGTFYRPVANTTNSIWGQKDHVLSENFEAVRPLAMKAIKTSACP